MRLPLVEMMMQAHYEIMAIFFLFEVRVLSDESDRKSYKQLILFDLRRNFYLNLWCNIKLKQCHRLNVTHENRPKDGELLDLESGTITQVSNIICSNQNSDVNTPKGKKRG